MEFFEFQLIHATVVSKEFHFSTSWITDNLLNVKMQFCTFFFFFLIQDNLKVNMLMIKVRNLMLFEHFFSTYFERKRFFLLSIVEWMSGNKLFTVWRKKKRKKKNKINLKIIFLFVERQFLRLFTFFIC